MIPKTTMPPSGSFKPSCNQSGNAAASRPSGMPLKYKICRLALKNIAALYNYKLKVTF